MKKKMLSRAAALSLAGLTTMSSIAIVASADAFPTKVYEFTYKGIASTARSASATNAMGDNDYVTDTDDAAVFTTGFKVEGEFATVFKPDADYLGSYLDTLNFSDGSTWQYKNAKDFTGAATVVKPEDSILERGSDGTAGDPLLEETFYFKSLAERDAAKSTIASKNQSEYSTKYSKAYSALKSDLSKIASAHKKEAEKLAKEAKAEEYEAYKEACKDADADTKAAAKEAYDEYVETVYEPAMEAAKEAYKEMTDAAKVVLKEFEEAYAPKHRGFSHTEKPDSADEDYAVFLIDDSEPYVVIGGVAGSTYQDAKYTTVGGDTLILADCKYRTQGSYVDPTTYAFTGEIVKADDLNTSITTHGTFLVSGDYWQQFSSGFEGGVSNNENSSEKGGSTSKDNDDDDKTKTPDQTAVYKVGSTYYPTYSAAYSAAAGNADIISLVRDYTNLPDDYFSQVTGSFYSTYDAALKASGNNSSKVTVFNGASTSTNDSNLDPYYYYWLSKQNGTTTSKDTSSATLGKKTGWAAIANQLNKSSAGSSATVNMNDETTVPSSVLSAIEGKNVTVKFVQDNGASLTVNGKDIEDSKNVEINVTYNTKSVSKKLIQNAFKKNGAVSSAQISIDEGSFGFDSDLTVKFNSKRAGYSAKIYRYNASRNSLQLVDTATVSNSGKTTFNNITKGGEFVIVLFED
ncbi:MAG: hypothetical protein IJC04_11095 [Oscillospiraceae bacterium]|nr:hypothetical protein [Oscillospiraceae bacterium]